MAPVLILDLDNTIIGNITYQLLAHSLCNKACKNSTLVTNCYNEKSGVIRPGFCYFIATIRNKIPDIKIYVYTASQKDWALKEIKWIEKCCNLKFDRPVLTRDDCIEMNNSYYKSIKKISKKIKYIDRNDILIIDNNDVFIDYKESFIKCSDYNYIAFIDMWKLIPKTTLQKPEVSNFIEKLISEGYVNPYNIENLGENLEHSIRYVGWFYKKLNKINKINKRSNTDTFWKKMIKAVSASTTLKEVKLLYDN